MVGFYVCFVRDDGRSRERVLRLMVEQKEENEEKVFTYRESVREGEGEGTGWMYLRVHSWPIVDSSLAAFVRPFLSYGIVHSRTGISPIKLSD